MRSEIPSPSKEMSEASGKLRENIISKYTFHLPSKHSAPSRTSSPNRKANFPENFRLQDGWESIKISLNHDPVANRESRARVIFKSVNESTGVSLNASSGTRSGNVRDLFEAIAAFDDLQLRDSSVRHLRPTRD